MAVVGEHVRALPAAHALPGGNAGARRRRAGLSGTARRTAHAAVHDVRGRVDARPAARRQIRVAACRTDATITEQLGRTSVAALPAVVGIGLCVGAARSARGERSNALTAAGSTFLPDLAARAAAAAVTGVGLYVGAHTGTAGGEAGAATSGAPTTAVVSRRRRAAEHHDERRQSDPRARQGPSRSLRRGSTVRSWRWHHHAKLKRFSSRS